MTADRSVYRLGKLCNVAVLRNSVRRFRGQSYQADRFVELLQSAFPLPAMRTPTQERAITAAILHAQAVRAALDHQVEVLALVTGEAES